MPCSSQIIRDARSTGNLTKEEKCDSLKPIIHSQKYFNSQLRMSDIQAFLSYLFF